jgi:hypothetical protein
MTAAACGLAYFPGGKRNYVDVKEKWRKLINGGWSEKIATQEQVTPLLT